MQFSTATVALSQFNAPGVVSAARVVTDSVSALDGSKATSTATSELEGLDIHEHGTPAYHVEFGHGMTYTLPSNLPRNGGASDPITAPKATEPV